MRSANPSGTGTAKRARKTLLVGVDAAGEGPAKRAASDMRQRLVAQTIRIGELGAAESEAVHFRAGSDDRDVGTHFAPLAAWVGEPASAPRSAWRARVRRVMIAPSVVSSNCAISAQE